MRTRTFKRLIALAAIVIAASIVVVGIGALWMGGQLMAAAPSAVGAPPSDLPIEVVAIPSESGSTLAGWFAPATASKGVVVLLHPIRGSRLSMLNRARLFFGEGYSVLLVDFQASGESPGEHITVGYLERFDAKAAVEFARQRCPGQRVAVDGASLGGAAALLASPLRIDALMIEAVYPTIDDAVRNRIAQHLPVGEGLLAELLLVQLKPRLGFDRTQLRPIDFIARVHCPILILAGGNDALTPIAETQCMYDAAVGKKMMCVIEGLGHVDLCDEAPEQFRHAALGFLEAHIATRQETPP